MTHQFTSTSLDHWPPKGWCINPRTQATSGLLLTKAGEGAGTQEGVVVIRWVGRAAVIRQDRGEFAGLQAIYADTSWGSPGKLC